MTKEELIQYLKEELHLEISYSCAWGESKIKYLLSVAGEEIVSDYFCIPGDTQ